MIKKYCGTFWARIYIAGPKHKAEDICRQFVSRGACVNVSETNYIFKYGEQTGVCVELINYPRFEKLPVEISTMANDLGILLMEGMNQGSFSIVTPTQTYFYDRREEK